MYMKQNVTLSIDEETLIKLKDHYQNYLQDNNGEYIEFVANYNGIIITAYSSKKEKRKVVFFGEDALQEAKLWDENAEVKEKKESEKKEWIFFEDQIGSDEVGVGDFLGPMIVVAAFVSGRDIIALKKYGIQDSKKMSDKQILEIGPKITKKFHYSKLTLNNEKYNEMLDKGENLNSMKAKMHNRALLNMHKAYEDVLNIFVDQFVAEKTYYKYLNDDKEEQVKGICFKTKGESYYPSVALASVIARYAYLIEMEKLSKKYDMDFPFGASHKVDLFAKQFVDRYGEQELYKIAKKNFANYNEVLNK